jgi:DNA-binding GntR family transcriptional regulator
MRLTTIQATVPRHEAREWNRRERVAGSKAEQIYTLLQTEILQQKLRPGAPVSESELARRTSVSRTPIREALQRLRIENLVEYVPGKGAFVKVLSRNEIRDAYEMVEALEGTCCSIVTDRASREDIRGLLPHMESMDRAIGQQPIQMSEWLIADERFHLAIYQLCPNEKMAADLCRLNSQIHYVRMTITPHIVDKVQSTRDHHEMYEAMLEGRREDARHHSQNHWSRVRREIMAVMDTYLASVV